MLVVIDLFSRFPEVYTVRDLTTETLIEKTGDYFARYGLPDAVLTDRGSQFESYKFREYLKKFGIKKLRTTAYHPQGNGLCERFNKTIQQDTMAVRVANGGEYCDWPKYLKTALLHYRNTPHSATGYNPSVLFLGFSVKTFACRQNQIDLQRQLKLLGRQPVTIRSIMTVRQKTDSSTRVSK